VWKTKDNAETDHEEGGGSFHNGFVWLRIMTWMSSSNANERSDSNQGSGNLTTAILALLFRVNLVCMCVDFDMLED